VNKDYLQELYKFWSGLEFTPTTPLKTGITWLELRIWFEITTRNRTPSSLKLLPTTPGPLALPTHLATLLNNFRNASRIITHQTSDHPNIKQLTYACPHARTRLRDIGTLTSLSGMAICPMIKLETQHAIANIILRLIGPTNSIEAENHFNSTLRKTLRPLTLHKPAPCRSKPIPGELATNPNQPGDDGLSPPVAPPDGNPPKLCISLPPKGSTAKTKPAKPEPSTTPMQEKPPKRKLNKNTLGRSTPTTDTTLSFQVRCKPPCKTIHYRLEKSILQTNAYTGAIANKSCNDWDKAHLITILCCAKCKATLNTCKCRLDPALGHVHVTSPLAGSLAWADAVGGI
jgi:hypothetical protein